ncbi:hypothetical protein B5V46_14730 [Rhodovulum sp. MB263]|nr:hypothetical protein B5V46_14730 [Rhodovulum sp. MB263]
MGSSSWIARKREALGFSNVPGRSRVEFSSEQVRIAYDAAGSLAGAARLMGINRQTFRRLYAQVPDQKEPTHRDNSDQSLGTDRLAKGRAAAGRVGPRVSYSEEELKKFFDDEWGES